MKEFGCQLAASVGDLKRTHHVIHIRVERGHSSRHAFRRYAKEAPGQHHISVVRLRFGGAKRMDEPLVHQQRGVDQGRQHPEQESWIGRAVTGASHPAMRRVDHRHRASRLDGSAKRHRERGPQRPQKSLERVRTKGAMLGYGSRDSRVSDLHEQRPATAEERDPFSMDPPDHRRVREERFVRNHGGQPLVAVLVQLTNGQPHARSAYTQQILGRALPVPKP